MLFDIQFPACPQTLIYAWVLHVEQTDIGAQANLYMVCGHHCTHPQLTVPCECTTHVGEVLQVSHLLGEAQHGKAVLGAQEASMMVWALAVLHQLNPTVWTALLDVIAAAPQESLDEVAHHILVTLPHLQPLQF